MRTSRHEDSTESTSQTSAGPYDIHIPPAMEDAAVE